MRRCMCWSGHSKLYKKECTVQTTQFIFYSDSLNLALQAFNGQSLKRLTLRGSCFFKASRTVRNECNTEPVIWIGDYSIATPIIISNLEHLSIFSPQESFHSFDMRRFEVLTRLQSLKIQLDLIGEAYLLSTFKDLPWWASFTDKSYLFTTFGEGAALRCNY